MGTVIVVGIQRMIMFACLSGLGYNTQFADHYMLKDAQASRCVDKVTACYYRNGEKGPKGDIAECMAKLNRPAEY